MPSSSSSSSFFFCAFPFSLCWHLEEFDSGCTFPLVKRDQTFVDYLWEIIVQCFSDIFLLATENSLLGHDLLIAEGIKLSIAKTDCKSCCFQAMFCVIGETVMILKIKLVKSNKVALHCSMRAAAAAGGSLQLFVVQSVLKPQNRGHWGVLASCLAGGKETATPQQLHCTSLP